MWSDLPLRKTRLAELEHEMVSVNRGRVIAMVQMREEVWSRALQQEWV